MNFSQHNNQFTNTATGLHGSHTEDQDVEWTFTEFTGFIGS